MTMKKENLYIGYIDGSLSDIQEKELEDMLSKEGSQAKTELFEMKDMADTARHGTMPIREQERKIISLVSKAERYERRQKHKRTAYNIIGYAAVAVIAFFVGIYAVLTKQTSEKKNMAVYACAGNKTDLTLPDGTKVTLKSSSTLQYDINRFGKGTRQVYLDGEAYFDVTRIPESKFIIKTLRQKVTVHGTSFNLQAYDNDKSNTLTLLDGNVSIDLFDLSGKKIRSLDINPMEKCTWDLRSGQTQVEKIDGTEAGLGWNDNIFYFRDMSMADIAERLEHYYDVNIVTFNLENDSERFSGGLSLNQSVSEIMRTLNYDKKFSIRRIDDNHFSISRTATK
ncbi:MAG: DUF4974 domain-containing protein [Bacteroidales bacterium]|nr:DUF4974 domain-containing protein [Bacteroidales bacterium]